MLTASQLCGIARQTARAVNYTTVSGQLLNSILSDLCQAHDFDACKKTFNFNFTPAKAQIGNLNAQLASGPFTLPVDYLRAKRGDVMWFNQNFPYYLVPCDLEEFDLLVQQAGIMSFPTIWATDMSQASPVLTTTGNTHGTTTLDTLGSVSGLQAGLGVSGPGIVPGTTVLSVGVNSVVLSSAATSSVTAGSFFFGVCPIAYVWPPASGAYPCMVRYYSQMPDIASPENSSQIPWFPNQGILRKKLEAALMELTSDTRRADYEASADQQMHNFLALKDDTSNRAKRITLDRRRFGPSYSVLPKSKVLGWAISFCAIITPLMVVLEEILHGSIG